MEKTVYNLKCLITIAKMSKLGVNSDSLLSRSYLYYLCVLKRKKVAEVRNTELTSDFKTYPFEVFRLFNTFPYNTLVSTADLFKLLTLQ